MQVWDIMNMSHYNWFSIGSSNCLAQNRCWTRSLSKGPTGTMLALVQVVAWNQACEKPLHKQMTQSTDAHMDNKASMSWTARWHSIWSLYYPIFHTPYTAKLIHGSYSFCVGHTDTQTNTNSKHVVFVYRTINGGRAMSLTHLPHVPHICVSESGQHWFNDDSVHWHTPVSWDLNDITCYITCQSTCYIISHPLMLIHGLGSYHASAYRHSHNC